MKEFVLLVPYASENLDVEEDESEERDEAGGYEAEPIYIES